MNTRHTESELKFLAPPEMTIQAFEKWAKRQNPLRHVTVSGLDNYYQQGINIVRHRHGGRSHELTVKKRQSDKSITHRLEVDLFFGAKTTPEDVQTFLVASGWSPVLALHKDSSIFNMEDAGVGICCALYQVNGGQSYIEVEVEKGGPESVDASAVLDYWHKKLLRSFPSLGKPLNASLFEIYYGRKQKIKKAFSKVIKDHHKTLAALAAIPD